MTADSILSHLWDGKQHTVSSWQVSVSPTVSLLRAGVSGIYPRPAVSTVVHPPWARSSTIHPPVHLPTLYPSIHPCIHCSVCPPIRHPPSVHPSVHPLICPSIHPLFTHLSTHPPIHYSSVCLSIHPGIHSLLFFFLFLSHCFPSPLSPPHRAGVFPECVRSSSSCEVSGMR